jgi:hypothetical protein
MMMMIKLVSAISMLHTICHRADNVNDDAFTYTEHMLSFLALHNMRHIPIFNWDNYISNSIENNIETHLRYDAFNTRTFSDYHSLRGNTMLSIVTILQSQTTSLQPTQLRECHTGERFLFQNDFCWYLQFYMCIPHAVLKKNSTTHVKSVVQLLTAPVAVNCKLQSHVKILNQPDSIRVCTITGRVNAKLNLTRSMTTL